MTEYTNQRREGEDFADYKARVKAQNAVEKQAARNPNVLWNSSLKGTYNKKAHGPLTD